ncbi:MAG: hypothetical protein CL669_02365 [Balneola sp.]|nr:hypothetical protein [Balneola sp.]
MSTTFKTPVKSRRGLSFFIGFIGAYLVPIGLNNLLVVIGLRETLSATNTEYIAYGVSGLFLGYACMSITPVHRVRILSYLIGSILVMDAIAFFSGRLPLAFLIDRMVFLSSFSISGAISLFLNKESTIETEANADG